MIKLAQILLIGIKVTLYFLGGITMDIFDVMWLVVNLFGAGLSGVYIYVAHLERAKTHGTSLKFSWHL